MASSIPPRGLQNPRPIRPAGDDQKKRNASPTVAKKRKITAVACRLCQRKRCKCDGARPRCTACVAAGPSTECIYDTRSDQSRLDALKEKNTELQEENDRLRELLESGNNDEFAASHPPEASSSQHLPRNRPSQRSSTAASPVFEAAERHSAGYGEYQSSSHAESPQQLHSARGSSASTSLAPKAMDVLQSKVAQLEAELSSLRGAFSQMQTQESVPFPWNKRSTTGQDQVETQGIRSRTDPAVARSLPKATSQSHGGSWRPKTQERGRRPEAKNAGAEFEGLAANEELIFEGTGTLPNPPIPYKYKPRAFSGYLEVFGNLPLSSAIMANFHTGSIQSAQVSSLRFPMHLIQMLNWEDHVGISHNVLTPEFASSTFSSFRAYGRRLLAHGAAAEVVLGPSSIDVQQFFEADRDPQSHTTATFAPWFLGAYPSMTISARVACAVMMQKLLRWQISPTSAHYDSLPEWFRAIGAQIFIPHLSAFDFLPWPEIRQVLIDEDISARQILALIMSNLAIDWPGATEAIFTWNYETGLAVGVNPDFLERVLDLNNWGINVKVLDVVPWLEGKARFMELDEELEHAAVTATSDNQTNDAV